MQQGPIYPMKADSHIEIQNHLELHYGSSNIWPVIWHDISPVTSKKYELRFVTFEVNNKSILNSKLFQNSLVLNSFNFQMPFYYLDFINPTNSRSISNNQIPQFLYNSLPYVESSYELITNHNYNREKLSTIDLDYLWISKSGEIRALEVTTFYKNLHSYEEAKRLFSFAIQKRFSRNNAYHLNLISDVANNIFNAKIYFAYVNTIQNSNNITPSINVDISMAHAIFECQKNIFQHAYLT